MATLAELREECEALEIPKHGNKAKVVKRLAQYAAVAAGPSDEAEGQTAETDAKVAKLNTFIVKDAETKQNSHIVDVEPQYPNYVRVWECDSKGIPKRNTEGDPKRYKRFPKVVVQAMLDNAEQMEAVISA